MKEFRVGIFGCARGAAHMRSIAALDGAKVVAICDRDPEKIRSALEFCPPDVKVFGDWRELLDAAAPHRVTWNWVKGHAGHSYNERCDRLAVEGAARAGKEGK